MTTLTHLATNTFIITRLVTISGYKKDYTTTTGIRGSLQPLSPSKTNLFNGVMGKTFRIFAEGSIDIQEGDKLRNTGTNAIYKVKNGGVTRRSMGAVDYKECIIEEVS